MTRGSSSVVIRKVLISAMLLSLIAALFVDLNAFRSLAQARDVVLDRGKVADAARLTGMADAYLAGGQSRVREAESARLTGLAHHHLAASDPDCRFVGTTRAHRAYAERLTGQAEHATGSFTRREPVLTRERIAAALRLSGIASQLGLAVDVTAPALACLGGP